MKLVCKIACLALLMNTLPGTGQERVFYKTVQVNGLNIFYREAGPANGPVILLLHGVPTSSRMYQPMLESSLSRTYSREELLGWFSFADVPSREYQLQILGSSAFARGKMFCLIGRPL
jgi:hypothetical protein